MCLVYEAFTREPTSTLSLCTHTRTLYIGYVENCIPTQIDAECNHHHQHHTIEFARYWSDRKVYILWHVRALAHHLQAFNKTFAAQTRRLHEHMLIY